MAVTPRELADAAVDARLVEPDVLLRGPAPERSGRDAYVEELTTAGRFPAAALWRAVAEARGMPFFDCDVAPPALAEARRLPAVLLRRGLVLPVATADGPALAVADPDDRATLQTAQRMVGRPVPVGLAEPGALRDAAGRALAALGRGDGAAVLGADDAIALLDSILKEAWLRRASDVHLEPVEEGARVRVRIDGRLHELRRSLRPAEGRGLLGRIKVLAGLDITEQRAPQDGGFTWEVPVPGAAPVDLRAATIPTRLGERATLRLLGTATADLTLTTLGMEREDLDAFRRAIRRPYGILLLCGPTGSGKSTTLYAAIREIRDPQIHVVTVEDPIEYTIDGVSQVHVGGSDKVTFASAIRSILRHDPDVIMIGEIRDAETADIALKAAMTGHLVLSTLHTNTAAGAIARLLDLGCEPFRIAGTLAGAVAQRLVRRLCPRCARRRDATADEEAFVGGPAEVADPVGCARCLGTGYAGRIGIFETLWSDPELARRIARGAPEADLRAVRRERLRPLRADAIRKVRAGITTVDEVRRAVLVEED